MADQPSPQLAPAEVYAPPQHRRGSRIATPIWLALLVVAALAGAYVGHYVLLEPINFGALGGKTSISESGLDKVVATYSFGGEAYSVTAREAIAQSASLDTMRNADGTYAMPSAESVLSAARTAVLMRDVEAHGIEASDEELVAYASENFGTEDIASLASAYTMDEQDVRERLRESCAIAKLRAEVVVAPGDEPVAPTAPADGKQETASADYASYIIGLAGDEWDAEKGIWASGDGPFATALKEYDVRSDSATYAAAQTAYNIAYQLYSDAITSSTRQWTDYVNALLCQANLALSSIVT